MAKYGKAAQKNVESAMRRRKAGTLKSGSGRTVRSRKQAIAIALSEAREKGGKVPPEPGGRKRAAKGTRKRTTKKTAKKATKRTRKRATTRAAKRTAKRATSRTRTARKR